MAEPDRAVQWVQARWRTGVALAWFAVALLLIVYKLPDIVQFALGDTDDNLRLAQVRALIAGQGWYDLTQYRLAPPGGADIHWSRLPDLPIAGLIVMLRPIFGTVIAEQWAVALAPLIPLGIGFVSIALVAQRLIDPAAWPVALLIAFCATLLMPMWMPLRIDHHGWQLALLALAWAGLVDPVARRGGVTSGIATALSLAIGVEMLVFLALIGAATALFWVADGKAGRALGYGAALAGSTGIGFALFASEANRAPVCDALSPVWLSAMVAAGGIMVLLALLAPNKPSHRLLAMAGAGALLATGFALVWPDCLARPEGVDPLLQQVWLDQVQEARPVTALGWREAIVMIGLPLSGIIGYALAIRGAKEPDRRYRWIASAALAATGFALLFWQVRLSPAAQLFAVGGGTLIAWRLVPRWRRSANMIVRIMGTLAALALATGLYVAIPLMLFPKPQAEQAGEEAAASCLARTTLAPLSALEPGIVLAPVDLGPRLIVMTPMDALAGPYHRNGEAILDIFRAFRGGDRAARRIIAARGVDYVLICDGLGGAVHYGGGAPASLYDRLDKDAAPGWLEPVLLPKDSPLRLWRVRRG